MIKQRLKDKVAIITGGSRGIGRATAVLFAKEGAKVVINYNQNKLEAEKTLEIVGKGNGMIVQADISKEEDIRRLVSETVNRFGKIDILINNAGIVFDVPLLEKTKEQWQKTIDTNLIGPFLLSKYCFEYLKKTRGTIINIASTNGINAFNPNSVDYDASKAGLVSLTRDLAEAFAPDVRVNCLAPGWVDTEMNKDLPKEYMDKEKEKVLLKRIAAPEEMARCILFLASEESSFVNGSVLVADGGFYGY